MNVEPEFGDTPIEDDPTGMRALLGSLPDPGPMPPELEARILASLAAQAGRRGLDAPGTAGEGVSEPGFDVPDVPRAAGASVVTPIHARAGSGATPRPLRWLAAAAAVGVLGAGGFGLIRMLTNGLSASDSSGAALDAPRPVPSANPSAGELSQGATRAPSAPASLEKDPTVLVGASGANYSADTLGEQAGRRMLGAGLEAPRASAQPVVVTEAGALACAAAVGAKDPNTIRVDLGTYEGKDAALLLTEVAGRWSAYAVPRTCGDGAAVTPLAGPIAVP